MSFPRSRAPLLWHLFISSHLIHLHAMLSSPPSDFFRLMNEVENEDLVFTLEVLVRKLDEEMAPYALGLIQNLVRAAYEMR